MHSAKKGRARLVLAIIVVVALSACGGGDARTSQLQPGMSRDSALAALAAPVSGEKATDTSTTPSDSLQHIWRRLPYFMDGRNIEILFYSPSGEKWSARDTVPEQKVIPVVLIDGKVIGVGRTIYDQTVAQYRLPKNMY